MDRQGDAVTGRRDAPLSSRPVGGGDADSRGQEGPPLAGLTLEQRVGQMLMVAFPGTAVTSEVEALLAECHVGGVCLFGGNVQSPWQVARLTADLQGVAMQADGLPMLIGIDQEGGAVSRLSYPVAEAPSAMAVGATFDPLAAEAVAGALAAELAALGINMNFAPVADVNTSPYNPVIGTRSYGDSPALVAAMVEAAIRGHRRHGVLTVAKHFPGHGDTLADSHCALPEVDHGWDRVASVELPPFRAAIRAGVDGICTSHVVYRRVDPTGLPATLSPFLLWLLLRGQMGFQGLIISDAMEMEAIAGVYGVVEGSILAVRAGVDVVLLVGKPQEQRRVYQALLEAVRSGLIPEARIDLSVARILEAKRRVSGSIQHGVWPKPGHGETMRRVAAGAVTLVRDREGLLPLRLAPHQRLGLVEFVSGSRSPVESGSGEPLGRSTLELLLRQHHPNTVSLVVAPGVGPAPEFLGAFALGCDVVLAATRNALLDPEQAELVRTLQEVGRPLVVVALRGPYDLMAFPEVDCYLATYGEAGCSLEGLVAVLTGRQEPRGRLPVALPGLYPAGHGLGLGGHAIPAACAP